MSTVSRQRQWESSSNSKTSYQILIATGMLEKHTSMFHYRHSGKRFLTPEERLRSVQVGLFLLEVLKIDLKTVEPYTKPS